MKIKIDIVNIGQIIREEKFYWMKKQTPAAKVKQK